MFCKNCGAKISDDSTFCEKCGGAVNSSGAMGPNGGQFYGGGQNSPGGVCCPRCRSGNLQAIVESNTTGSGGGYSAGKGCLGYLIFGPLGLLCGACGKKQSLSTTNKTFWVCRDCGNKFRNAQEAMKEYKKNSIAAFVFGAFLAVMALLIIVISFAASADAGNSAGNMVLAFGLFFLVLAVILIVAGAAYWKEYISHKTENDANSRNSGR